MDQYNNDMRSVIDYVQHELQFSDDHVLKFVENALFLPSQAHHWHLQAQSHAVHVELDELYKELPEYVDYFVEVLMSSRGSLVPSGDNGYTFQSIDNCIPTLEAFIKQCTAIHHFLDEQEEYASVNALEDIMSFVESIITKLKYLP